MEGERPPWASATIGTPREFCAETPMFVDSQLLTSYYRVQSRGEMTRTSSVSPNDQDSECCALWLTVMNRSVIKEEKSTSESPSIPIY